MRHSPVEARPPTLRRPHGVLSTGPTLYHLTQPPRVITGLLPPPRGFVTATTSASEWIVFAWLWYVSQGRFDAPNGGIWNERNWSGPPDRAFSYQKILLGGRKRLGGAVADFLIRRASSEFVVRLDTYQFHIATDVENQARDFEQELRLFERGRSTVVILYEQYVLIEPEEINGSAHRCVRDAYNGIEWLSPLSSGQVVQTRWKVRV